MTKFRSELQARLQERAAAWVAQHLVESDARAGLALALLGMLTLEQAILEAEQELVAGDASGARATLRGALDACRDVGVL